MRPQMANRYLKKHPTFLIGTLIVFLCFSSFQNSIYADETSSEYKLNQEFLKSFLNDFRGVVASPKDWGKKDFFKLSAILATGTFLFAFDDEINDWFYGNRNSSSDDVSRLISSLGHGLLLGSFLTALYGSGEIFDSSKLRKTALLSFESWMISGAIVSTTKFLTGRMRPQNDESSFMFHPFSFRSRFHSFPSGHASSAFAVATVIADQSEKLYVDFLAYNLAALVALSRVHDSEHWASDIFIGAVIGYFVAKRVSALNRRNENKKINLNVQFSPQRQTITLSVYF